MLISTTRFDRAIMILLFDDIKKETFISWLLKPIVEKIKYHIENGINSAEGKYYLSYLGQT